MASFYQTRSKAQNQEIIRKSPFEYKHHPTERYVHVLLWLHLLIPPAGEVQRGSEEDPQACDRHGGVSVHAAQPEHQQAVQRRKTSRAFN